MIILFGLAGSGKGTQGKALSELLGWKALSVGQVIRDTGEYDDIIKNGGLIPDEDVTNMMTKQIARAEDEGFDVILDGYPRTKVQAEYLADHMADKIDGAVILDVPKEELYARLALRGRDDDKEKEAIDRRFEIFEQNIGAIIPLLEAKNIPVTHVNGVGEIGTVTGRLLAAVREFNPNATIQTSDVNGDEIEKSYGE
ncbi:nucleoside monophosphate kinase [Candidatus Saccharibacteria bacterium]|nr:nucleoside monophosphate kinase [Candidatus Saccharibacteria bacterium]